MANRLTHKVYFNAIVDALNGKETEITREDMVAFLEGRIAQLEKKNAHRSTKPSATRVKLEANAQKVFAWMKEDAEKAYLLSEVRIHFEFASPQKTTPIMNYLVDAGLVVRYTEKSTVYYKLV